MKPGQLQNMYVQLHVNGKLLLFPVQCGFNRLVQRIFHCDKIQNISLTPDKVLNILVYAMLFCVIMYKVKTFKSGPVFYGPPSILRHVMDYKTI